jgi:hypothetical protein
MNFFLLECVIPTGGFYSVFSNFEKIRYCPHFVRLSVCLSVTLLLFMGLTDWGDLWFGR